MTSAGAAWGVAAAAGGIGLLRWSWATRSGVRAAAGWAVLATGPLGWALAGAAWDKALALAALAPSLVALAVLAAGTAFDGGVRTRSPRARPVAQRLAGSSPRLWRILARAACAGPVAGGAALALAAAAAAHGPGAAGDRLVTADLVTPLVWAAGGVWATTDVRIGRVAAGLSALAAAGLGVALS